MRLSKVVKSVTSLVLASAMVITGVNYTSTKADAEDATYTAKLGGQMDTAKATVGEWDAAAEVSFKLGEETTLTYETGDKVGCWSGNFIGIDTDLTYTQDMVGKITSVKFDGVEPEGINYDGLVFGTENESKTTARFTLINKWGGVNDGIFGADFQFPTFNKMEITFVVNPKEAPAASEEPTVAPSEEPTVAPSEEPTVAPADDPSVAENDAVWAAEGVHAYVYYQTSAWDCRNDKQAAGDKGPFDEFSYRYIKAGGADVSKTAQVKDVLITKDGTYTVKIAGIDLSGADSFNQLGISTDLVVPQAEKDAAEALDKDGKDTSSAFSVSVKDVTVKVDNNEVEGLKNVVLPHNAESDYYLFTAANIWSPNASIPFNKDKDPLSVVPEDSIEITFTISGLKSNTTPDTPSDSTKNPCKKVKAAKSKVTVKKGKTTTVAFNLTNTIPSKKTTDTIKVTSSKKKVVKIAKITKSAKKVSVKVKGLKKGKSVVQIKVGKKTAKTTVTVK